MPLPKPKLNPAAELKAMLAWPWRQKLRENGNLAMQKLFGLPQDWYLKRDIAKNNLELGEQNLKAGRYKDAWLRFRLVVWVSPKHAAGWRLLGETYLKMGKPGKAGSALKKALMLAPGDAEAAKLLEDVAKSL